jgi:hypothetical protein
MRPMTAEQKFLRECNGNRTLRTFGPKDFRAYKSALKDAQKAALLGEPFFASWHSEVGISALYALDCYNLEIAVWAVWVLDGEVRSEFGSRPFRYGRPWTLYTYTSYMNMVRHREWVSPTYPICDGVGVAFDAIWNVRKGKACGQVRMGMLFSNGWVPELTRDIWRSLPERICEAFLDRGFRWDWPDGTLELDAEAILRQRAEEFAVYLPALAVLVPEDLKIDPVEN